MSAKLDPPAVQARIDHVSMVHDHAHRPDCQCHGCAVRRLWHGPITAVIDTQALDHADPSWTTRNHAARRLAAARTYDAMSAAIGSQTTYADAEAAADASALALQNLTGAL